MKATCPRNPDHDRFITKVQVVESWIVKPNGEFVSEYRGSKQVTQKPRPGNVWECKTCGASATVEV